MTDPATFITVAMSATFGMTIFSAAALKGWQGWLDLKRMELQRNSRTLPRGPGGDVRELRERVKKLEAIASGEI